VFAISGLYDSIELMGDYMDELVYNNSPVIYLSNMPSDHPYLKEYAGRNMLFVVGQGAWEGPLLESTRRLDTVCAQKGIPARFEYWGFDVNHDWPWWYKMVALYAPKLLGL
jgi:esterase/lipase superfamily enzyme